MTKEELIQAIGEMTVLELAELVTALEEKFGVSAAAPMAVAAGPVAAAAVADDRELEGVAFVPEVHMRPRLGAGAYVMDEALAPADAGTCGDCDQDQHHQTSRTLRKDTSIHLIRSLHAAATNTVGNPRLILSSRPPAANHNPRLVRNPCCLPRPSPIPAPKRDN